MDGWMDGWMDGYDRQEMVMVDNGWMKMTEDEGQMDKCMDTGRRDKQTNGCYMVAYSSMSLRKLVLYFLR